MQVIKYWRWTYFRESRAHFNNLNQLLQINLHYSAQSTNTFVLQMISRDNILWPLSLLIRLLYKSHDISYILSYRYTSPNAWTKKVAQNPLYKALQTPEHILQFLTRIKITNSASRKKTVSRKLWCWSEELQLASDILCTWLSIWNWTQKKSNLWTWTSTPSTTFILHFHRVFLHMQTVSDLLSDLYNYKTDVLRFSRREEYFVTHASLRLRWREGEWTMDYCSLYFPVS